MLGCLILSMIQYMVFGALFGMRQVLLFFLGALVDGTIFAGFLNVVMGLSLLTLVGIFLLLATLDYCTVFVLYIQLYILGLLLLFTIGQLIVNIFNKIEKCTLLLVTQARFASPRALVVKSAVHSAPSHTLNTI